ncbi:MAG: helix-turn-helix transcriptional regulator [Marinilabiliaceae bacterium]|nr:helix-turn-helix transcriptional regulator [Marinilabiliaceae bacterium]
MKSNIQSIDIHNFYQSYSLNKENNLTFCSTVDVVEANPLKMLINEWKTSKFKAQHIQIESSKDLEVLGGMEDDSMVMLHFVSKGDTTFAYECKRLYRMDRNTNNIFAALNKKVNHSFYSNIQYEFFKVFLPYDFVYSICHQNPEAFAPLISSIENQRPLILPERHCLTTIEMKLVIDQIKNCQAMGNMTSLYFENKVQELLLLQLQQREVHIESSSRKHRFYSDQLNTARNIIESRYQNPPSIAELALMVGMSATVLKERFKSSFGTTIFGYLFDYRMNIARQLLQDTSYTITEIAERTGYEHASHFTTAFKRKFGDSPNEFRKSIS